MKQVWFGLLGVLSLLLTACPGGGGVTCDPTGTGNLVVNVNGLPGGVNAAVTVSGPGGTQTLTTSQTLSNIAAGTYTVSAENVAQAHPLIRSAYGPVVSGSPACVQSGRSATITVSYSLIPTSGKLWLGEELTDRTLAFARESLGSTATLNPEPSANTRGGKGLAFDRDGNLWVVGGTTADPHLYRYPALSLTGSSPTPDRRIDLQGLTCSPGVDSLAFDEDGNLWIGAKCANRVYRLTREQLLGAGSGRATLSAGVVFQVNAPNSLAFDRDGNLWVGRGGSSDGTVVRFDRSRLEASYSGTADREIAATDGADRLDARHLAFDAAGHLWVMAYGDNALYHLTPAEQSGTGSVTLTPSVRVYLGAGSLLEGMAFDEAGGLWITYTADRFARLAPSQLTGAGSPGSPTVPERIFTVGTSGTQYPLSPALYPAPAGLPLYHRMP